ncbi:MAG: hypothetical protein K6C14_03745 [Eubacterium sp.]|nr:hypothetical protein [Eubacterium sp.]
MSLLLTSCTSRVYTPEIRSEFTAEAEYSFSGFKYKTKITVTPDTVIVELLTTAARGLIIKNDGKNITYAQGSMRKSFPVEKIDVTNPSRVIYDVFNDVVSLTPEIAGEQFVFKGECSAGRYILRLDRTGYAESLSLPQSDITINFLSY